VGLLKHIVGDCSIDIIKQGIAVATSCQMFACCHITEAADVLLIRIGCGFCWVTCHLMFRVNSIDFAH